MVGTKQLMHATSSKHDDKYDEEWKVVINTGGEYTLSKWQARTVMQAMSSGKREVMFETFLIPIPYIAEFYRVRRFLKDTIKLPARASEPPYKPIPEKKWRKLEKEIRSKLPRKIS